MSANVEMRPIERSLSRIAAIALLLILIPALSPAAVFTVGPNGSYATVQAGLDAAIAASAGGASNEVRVQAGQYAEHLSASMGAGTLGVSGGWNASFTARNPDPLSTWLDGSYNGRALNLVMTNTASLTLRGFRVLRGSSNSNGGGMYLGLYNAAFVRLADLQFAANSVGGSTSNALFGGALAVVAHNDSGLIVEDSDFFSNDAANSSGSAFAGGAYIGADGNANILLQRCIFADNTATPGSSGSAGNAAIHASVSQAAHLSVVDSRFRANRVVAGGTGFGQAATFRADCDSSCSIDLVRDVFDGNLGASLFQLYLIATGIASQGGVNIHDSTIVHGSAGGVFMNALDNARINAVNLTVVANQGDGIEAGGEWWLSNSLVWNNASDVAPSPSGRLSHNLFGFDPLFADAANGNYRLTAASPARNAGTASPPGDLSLYDLLGETRDNESAPDIGACEFGDRIFRGRFEHLQ